MPINPDKRRNDIDPRAFKSVARFLDGVEGRKAKAKQRKDKFDSAVESIMTVNGRRKKCGCGKWMSADATHCSKKCAKEVPQGW